MCMHVRVTDKRKANIWFACALYYNRHMPGVVSIPNFSLFWIYVLNNAPGKKNLEMHWRSSAGRVYWSIAVLSAPAAKRWMLLKNENVQIISQVMFFFVIIIVIVGHSIVLHLVPINCMPVDFKVSLNNHLVLMNNSLLRRNLISSRQKYFGIGS